MEQSMYPKTLAQTLEKKVNKLQKASLKDKKPVPDGGTAPAPSPDQSLVPPSSPATTHGLIDPETLLNAPNTKQTAKRLNKAVADSIALRKHLWPAIEDNELWLLNDKNKKGFAQPPRPLPIFMNMIGDASKYVSAKAIPAGRSYLVLWCRVFGEGIIKIENEMVAASEAGYFGERSVSTWREHLRVLKDLGFIDFKAGPAGPMHFILLLNPYKVAKKLKDQGWVQDVQYAALFQRALEIGAGPEMA
jgi:hypothetical protein